LTRRGIFPILPSRTSSPIVALRGSPAPLAFLHVQDVELRA
jgi:hypothetical protein